MQYPSIIQGGMGAAVSCWRLASAVSRLGHLGVVSGTALDLILARRLQDGDSGNDMRRALGAYPDQRAVERILAAYYVPGGKPQLAPYRKVPMFTAEPSRHLLELTAAAAFAEVYLARDGHDGLVGINLLEKIQLPNLALLYGAMLAGVDYVLMGAGIPREVPGILDRLARHEPARMSLNVEGAGPEDAFAITFDPRNLLGDHAPPLKRPLFLGIVASVPLATTLARRTVPPADGLVIEGPTAGGHNAPPRGILQLNGRGEPLYGPRDEVDLASIRALGLPFWLAGSYGSPSRLRAALQAGAQGVQVGTAFAFCDESGLADDVKRHVLRHVLDGDVDVLTDPRASPTGFPFKVVNLENTLSDSSLYHERRRVCDLGYLRHLYKKAPERIGFRCPAEPLKAYLSKDGNMDETENRKCLCNGLTSNVGLAQSRPWNYIEQPLVTAGDDLASLRRFISSHRLGYQAEDVVSYLLGDED